MQYTLESTWQYDKWFRNLKDSSSKIKILARLSRVENGNFGDFKQQGSNLYELRVFFDPGLRIYYTIRDGRIVLLLAVATNPVNNKTSRRRKFFWKKWRIERWLSKQDLLILLNT
ncbi:type II toxin-antitoxin system RelE/ParE family toxin [Desulfobacter postgatei]|uniref:type II toxin-antitoxin system RelE/ParE family toxin n=1 Tax=Desulfobacter postgatei TaxID=2293 RepID=UPI00259BD2A9|nr:type II toxin-antitoxin system RelE/ParE family toxin [uncultured Desulfobacter sp.]